MIPTRHNITKSFAVIHTFITIVRRLENNFSQLTVTLVRRKCCRDSWHWGCGSKLTCDFPTGKVDKFFVNDRTILQEVTVSLGCKEWVPCTSISILTFRPAVNFTLGFNGVNWNTLNYKGYCYNRQNKTFWYCHKSTENGLTDKKYLERTF